MSFQPVHDQEGREVLTPVQMIIKEKAKNLYKASGRQKTSLGSHLNLGDYL